MQFLNNDHSRRRTFLKTFVSVPVLTSGGIFVGSALASEPLYRKTADEKSSLKLSLNAYSFNRQLLNGSMTIDDMLAFCADNGLMAVDLTGYYFKGYPQVPSDETLYQVKNRAFRLGLEISGTG